MQRSRRTFPKMLESEWVYLSTTLPGLTRSITMTCLFRWLADVSVMPSVAPGDLAISTNSGPEALVTVSDWGKCFSFEWFFSVLSPDAPAYMKEQQWHSRVSPTLSSKADEIDAKKPLKAATTRCDGQGSLCNAFWVSQNEQFYTGKRQSSARGGRKYRRQQRIHIQFLISVAFH